MGSLRTVVAVLTVITALQMTVVSIGNITDYETSRRWAG
jgi:hypothetical protein